MRRVFIGLLAVTLVALSGCVTVAEFRKLEREVIDMQRGGAPGEGPPRERLADLATRLESLESQLDRVEGRVEVAEHRADEALKEARSAREASSAAAPAQTGELATPDGPSAAAGVGSDEISAYRDAYAAWRSGDSDVCVDRFRKFLQNHPSSAYADDAAYWMADCHFKQGDYKTAVLRFDDVVERYPAGNKAADALYRQGESLLRLGPGYGKAAGKAFERVVKEYPDSALAPEAKRQLRLLRSG